MNRHIHIVLIISILLASCKKENYPCDILTNGVYVFPKLPEKHGMTSQEVTEYWDLPTDIGQCISTEGLLETCLNYPELRLIMAGINPQHGYERLVKERFLGMRILETRQDRASCLLKKYKTVDPVGYDPNWELVDIGRYLFDIYYLEIIFSQETNLEALTETEIIGLLETALSIYEEKKEDMENHGLFGLECTTTLLGRLMILHEYQDFLKEYNENKKLQHHIKYYVGANMETTELVISYSHFFLNKLKNN